jgi:hypothetical protein
MKTPQTLGIQKLGRRNQFRPVGGNRCVRGTRKQEEPGWYYARSDARSAPKTGRTYTVSVTWLGKTPYEHSLRRPPPRSTGSSPCPFRLVINTLCPFWAAQTYIESAFTPGPQ